MIHAKPGGRKNAFGDIDWNQDAAAGRLMFDPRIAPGARLGSAFDPKRTLSLISVPFGSN